MHVLDTKLQLMKIEIESHLVLIKQSSALIVPEVGMPVNFQMFFLREEIRAS